MKSTSRKAQKTKTLKVSSTPKKLKPGKHNNKTKGLEMYHTIKKVIADELKAGTRNFQSVTEFKINRLDASDLLLLKESDLIALGFGEVEAEEVNNSLANWDLRPLGKKLVVTFKFDENNETPSLLDN